MALFRAIAMNDDAAKVMMTHTLNLLSIIPISICAKLIKDTTMAMKQKQTISTILFILSIQVFKPLP